MLIIKGMLIFVTAVAMILGNCMCYAEDVLRVPAGEIDKIDDDRLPEMVLNYMYPEISPHKVIVLDNKNQSQVSMRVCEISELRDEEEICKVKEAFYRWYDGAVKTGLEVKHPDALDWFDWILKMSRSEREEYFKKRDDRVYLIISDPEVNGHGGIEAEGFVIVEEGKYNELKLPIVACWEIRPSNRAISKSENKAKFIGAGRQVLFYAIYRELERLKKSKCQGIVFRLQEALPELKREGFEPEILYEEAYLYNYILKSTKNTLGYLKEFAETKKDKSAIRILKVSEALGELEGSLGQKRGELKKLLIDVLDPLRNGKIDVNVIRQLLAEKYEKIFKIVQELRDVTMKKLILNDDMDNYINYRLNQAPDYKICRIINGALVEALREIGFKEKAGLVKLEKDDFRHYVAELLYKEGKKEAGVIIDIAFGQIIGSDIGIIKVDWTQEYMEAVEKSKAIRAEKDLDNIDIAFKRIVEAKKHFEWLKKEMLSAI